MPSERVQRQIDRLLDEAEAALAVRDWEAVGNLASDAASLDPENLDALTFLEAARRNGADVGSRDPLADTPDLGADDRTVSPKSDAQPDSFVGGRYQVRKFLGEGGKKKVFLAHDALLDRDIAFSLIKMEGLDATGRERVMREAQAMGRLTHPHIVSIFDIGELSDETTPQPYIIQELMGGGDVEGLLEKSAGGLPLAQVLRIATEVCRGLQFAHAHDIVHRDLKPGNVWLTADGTAKIGDFGLAVSLERSRLTSHGMMVGTYQYMPPEQALGGEVNARADLYSLGAMMYELITGRTPFQGDSATAVISQHLNAPPVAPSWYSDHCPAALEALILRLLAKRPDDRPASAADVLAALEAIDPSAKPISHSSGVNPLERLARGVFVGRERELERLQQGLDQALSGRGSVVMLVGEPGIGKTRTVQELETYARLRGAEVYWGRTHESSGMPAFWPWIQVGAAWGTTHDVVALAAQGILPNPEMSRLFPDLRRLLPDLPPPSERTDESAQFLLFEAYTQFVRRESAQVPWVVVLDDLHWADKPTLQLLQYLARELANMRVLIVGTYRDTELARTHPLSDALAELNRSGAFQRVVLRGLSRPEVGEYIRQRSNVPVAAAVCDRIYEETEGNPFFLSQIVNLMAEEGTLGRASVSDIALPDGVREALGRRLDRLSADANALLQVAAIAGREFAYETLTLLNDRSADELLRLIEEAIDARVIEETDRPGRYQFTHALMQETLLEELTTTRRVRLHGQVAEALERRWGVRADEYASRLALHYAESSTLTAEHVGKAVRYLALAGKEAEARFAWAEAVRLYDRATTLMRESPEVSFDEDPASLLVALGRCARNEAQYRDYWRAMMRALDLYRARGDGSGFARASRELGVVMNIAPQNRLLPIWEEALDLLGASDEAMWAELAILVNGITASIETGIDPELTRQRYEKAEEISLRLGLTDVYARIQRHRAIELFKEGKFDAGGDLIQGIRQASINNLAASWEGRARIWAGRVSEAEAIFKTDLRQAEQLGLRVGSLQASGGDLAGVYLGRADFGAFDELASHYSEARGHYWAHARALRALLAGDISQCEKFLLGPEESGGEPTILGAIHLTRTIVFAHLGRWSDAMSEYEAIRRALRGGNYGSLDVGPTITGRELMPQYWHYTLADGFAWRLAADSEVGALRTVVRTRPGWFSARFLHEFSADRIFGDVAVGLDMLDDAERLYREALAWCERERYVVDEGRCWLGLSAVAERRNNHGDALACLERAGELFARHGIKLFLDQVIAKKDILKA
jgi:predicted ATPase